MKNSKLIVAVITALLGLSAISNLSAETKITAPITCSF